MLDTVQVVEVPGYPGFFVTESGEVYSDHTRIGGSRGARRGSPLHPRKLTLAGNGYLHLQVRSNDGVSRLVAVHTLMLLAFVGPRPEGCVCRHLDGNKLNNRRENLCWGSGKENNADMVRHGKTTRGERNYHAKLTEHQALEILGSQESREALAARFGVSQGTVSDIKSGRSWKHLNDLARKES